MKTNNIDVKSIEEIALEYLRFNNNKIIKMDFSSDTTVDACTYEKNCFNKNRDFFNQIGRSINFEKSYTKGKILYEENEKVDINFYKIPQKDLGEEEECTYSYNGFISSENISNNLTNNLVENYTVVIELRSIKKIKNNSKLFFPFNYANVYEGITEIYHPLLNNLETINSIKSLLSNSIINLDNFFNHNSVFEPSKKINVNLGKFLEEQKVFEYIEFNQTLMLFQIIDNESDDNYLVEFDDEKIYTIYQNNVLVLQKLYTNLMLELLINHFMNCNKQNINNVNLTNLNLISYLNISNNNFCTNNKNSIRNKELNTKKQISFENICFNYVQNFFKNTNRLTIEQVITTLNENLEEILRCLFINNEIFLLVFKNIDIKKYFSDNSIINKMNTIGKNPITTDCTGNINNEASINNLDDFQERYFYFQKMREYFSEKNTEKNTEQSSNNNTNLTKKYITQSTQKTKFNSKSKSKSKQKNKVNITFSNGNNININSYKTINNSSNKSYNNINNNTNNNINFNENYSKIKKITKSFFSTFKELITKNIITIPYLPPINKKKFTYTLVLDLDETLVHYVEEENHPFVQVRPYAAYFLQEMGKYFEIVIFTAAAEDYADLVLNELDKNNSISYRLYRRHTKPNKGAFLKDLSKLGRDITKTCIIDNNKDNFELQPQNGLHISTFIGEQNDNELLLLCNDLMKIVRSNKKDIRPIIKEINDVMNKRYIQDGNSFTDN